MNTYVENDRSQRQWHYSVWQVLNTHVVEWKSNDLTLLRMVADLLDASFPGQLPIISNPQLSSDIANGIPVF